MRRRRLASALLAAALFGAGAAPAAPEGPPILPWREAGCDERQAAAHLLDRLAFGARPGEVDRVVAQGLASWVEDQLATAREESALAVRLAAVPALDLPLDEYPRRYPGGGAVLREAVEAGVVPGDLGGTAADEARREAQRRRLAEFARLRGYRPPRELAAAAAAQKLLRAVYGENQLREVLVDFWFNHFNVATSDDLARPFVLAFERDAIRPHVLGTFRELLGAVARHPAMLFYLDNAQSAAGEFNENYARELLELHTLGVDGGYTEADVVAVARAFTGWTAVPPGSDPGGITGVAPRAPAAGFTFRAEAHDGGAKTVLGVALPPGRGIEDGEAVLDLLAAHPATASRLARKLAQRFVHDDPPPALVARLAAAFRASGGDLEAMLRALVESPEFWSREARSAKVKSPFELAVSAARALDADILHCGALVGWIERMGQPLYDYRAPSGFPEASGAWVSGGALVRRLRFALALAAGRVDGVAVDLPALAGGREVEARAALDAYLPLLLPGRDIEPTRALLAPLVTASRPVGRARLVGLVLGSPEFQRR